MMLSNERSSTLSFIEPNECPICKKAIKPVFLNAYLNVDQSSANIVFSCVACGQAFVKTIVDLEEPNPYVDDPYYEELFNETFLAPNPPLQISFTEYIINVSEAFVKIYNESNAAECAGLSEIAGVGYRKALEFLIKDYLISKFGSETAEKEKIERSLLSTCIKEYIDNPQLKIVAERAVWIGNDETHYTRKHKDKDVEDLKRLIDVTVRWIEMELMTKEANEKILPLH